MSYLERLDVILEKINSAEDAEALHLFDLNTAVNRTYPLRPIDGEAYYQRMCVECVALFQECCELEGVDPEAYGLKYGVEDHG